MSETSEEFTNVYINNIDPSIRNADLKEICEKYGGRVVSVIIIKEQGVSLGYGFCNFATHEEAVRAVEKMGNLFVMGKRLAVSRAASKADRAKFLRSVHSPPSRPGENANVYVKNLDYSIDEEALRGHFRPFGPIINVRIMRDDVGNSKGYGFVSYARHDDAARAVRALDGQRIGRLAIHADFYEPKKGKKKSAGPFPRAAVSAPASPVESYSKVKASASALVTPTQSKAPSPLVIPCNVEENAFCCGTPISNEEVPDVDQEEREEKENESSPALEEETKTIRNIDERNTDNDSESESESEEENEKSYTDTSITPAPEKERMNMKGIETVTTMQEGNNNNSNFNFSTKPFAPAHMSWNFKGCTSALTHASITEEIGRDRAGWSEADNLAMPNIAQLLERPYKENEIKVYGLRYFNSEKDVLRLFYDFKVVGARPIMNARGVCTGEWYVTFAAREDAERALAMCNNEYFSVRGCKTRAERVPFVKVTGPAFPTFRLLSRELLENQQQQQCCRGDSYEFSSLADGMGMYPNFSNVYF